MVRSLLSLKSFRRAILGVSLVFALPLLTGCGERSSVAAGTGGDAQVLSFSGKRDLPEFMFRPGFQDLLNHRIERRIEGMLSFLQMSDPVLRGDAALLLVAGGHPDPFSVLHPHLQDGWPSTRRDVARALGWAAHSDGGEAVAGALESEPDPSVRSELIRTLGRQGAEPALRFLIDWTPETAEEEAARVEAVGRMLLLGLTAPGAPQVLVDGLRSTEPLAREMAAWALGRSGEVDPWAPFAPAIRDALDALDPSDPARGGVVVALGRLGEPVEDTERLLSLLRDAPDWKLRVQGARAFAFGEAWVSVPEVQEALVSALSDPVIHVGVQAAQSLLPVLIEDDVLWDQTRDDLSSADIPDAVWATLFPAYVARAELDPVLAAAQSSSSVSSQARALAALTPIAEQVGPDVFLAGLQSRHPMVAAAAADGAVELWDRLSGLGLDTDDTDIEVQVLRTRLANAFLETLSEGLPAAASRVAMAMVDPAFREFRADAALEEALAIRHLEGIEDLTRALALAFIQTDRGRRSPLVETLLRDSEYQTRRAVATALTLTGRTDLDLSDLQIPNPERTIGWPFLSELGPYPRLEVRTSRGNLVVKLDATQAPLTVQTLAEQANTGLHDGTRFHRVLPNFVIQAGDVGLGDGTGGPSYRIQTELTRIPFERGVIGMASSGPHTEGSQWFITHSRQPHLDGSYTSFGWLLEGWDTLDAILEGDQVLSMRVVRDPNWAIPR